MSNPPAAHHQDDIEDRHDRTSGNHWELRRLQVTARRRRASARPPGRIGAQPLCDTPPTWRSRIAALWRCGWLLVLESYAILVDGRRRSGFEIIWMRANQRARRAGRVTPVESGLIALYSWEAGLGSSSHQSSSMTIPGMATYGRHPLSHSHSHPL